MNKYWKYDCSGIDDELFIRGKVPMTKAEVRSVTVSKLKLVRGLKVADIGAGTGSVTIECASLGCNVTSIERNPIGIDLIHQNIKCFDVDYVEVIEGLAPDNLPQDAMYDRVFIGGSGGNIEAIFEYLNDHLIDGGILVANTITIENTYMITQLLNKNGYKNIEAITMNVSRNKAVGSVNMMMAENPITIISGVKGERNE